VRVSMLCRRWEGVLEVVRGAKADFCEYMEGILSTEI
jgi:hypothetical protein